MTYAKKKQVHAIRQKKKTVCAVLGVPNVGDITHAVLWAHMWAKWSHNPCHLRDPQKRATKPVPSRHPYSRDDSKWQHSPLKRKKGWRCSFLFVGVGHLHSFFLGGGAVGRVYFLFGCGSRKTKRAPFFLAVCCVHFFLCRSGKENAQLVDFPLWRRSRTHGIFKFFFRATCAKKKVHATYRKKISNLHPTL